MKEAQSNRGKPRAPPSTREGRCKQRTAGGAGEVDKDDCACCHQARTNLSRHGGRRNTCPWRSFLTTMPAGMHGKGPRRPSTGLSSLLSPVHRGMGGGQRRSLHPHTGALRAAAPLAGANQAGDPRRRPRRLSGSESCEKPGPSRGTRPPPPLGGLPLIESSLQV